MELGPVTHSSLAYANQEFQADTINEDIPEQVENQQVNLENDPLDSQQGEEPRLDDVKGVIRLLQEGHFKGVADVRLRINFHYELQAMENAAKEELAQGEVQQFEGVVSGHIELFLQPPPDPDASDGETTENDIVVLQEAVVMFSADDIIAMQDAVDTFTATKGQFATDPVEDLTVRFDNLVIAIQGFTQPLVGAEGDVPELVNTSLPSPGDEPAVDDLPPVTGPMMENPDTEPVSDKGADEPVVAEEPGTDSTSVWDSLVSELKELFKGFLTDLDEKTASFSLLPELSAPSGMGKAYDKFLAAYQELKGDQPSPEIQPESVNVLV